MATVGRRRKGQTHDQLCQETVENFFECLSWIMRPAPLHSIQLKEVEGGWLLILKAYSKTQGKGKIMFCGGATPVDCFFNLPTATWKDDRDYRQLRLPLADSK